MQFYIWELQFQSKPFIYCMASHSHHTLPSSGHCVQLARHEIDKLQNAALALMKKLLHKCVLSYNSDSWFTY